MLQNDRWFGESLISNKELLENILKINGLMISYCNSEIKNDETIVKLAVQQNGYAFKYISDELKKNKEIQELAIYDDKITNKFDITNLFL